MFAQRRSLLCRSTPPPSTARLCDSQKLLIAHFTSRITRCCCYGSLALKRCLSTLSDRIFDSSVDRGTPSLAAAPVGPETQPLLAASAASTRDRSWAGQFVMQRRLRIRLDDALPHEPTLIDAPGIGVGHDNRPLDDILQFAAVAGPRIIAQQAGAPSHFANHWGMRAVFSPT